MKRHGVIFFAAIFLPSLVLGWLALRTAGDQQVLIERQAVNLHQAETDALAASMRGRLEEEQGEFAEVVRALAGTRGTAALAEDFGEAMKGAWQGGGVAFAIAPGGAIAYPQTPEARTDNDVKNFLKDNAAFLSNQTQAEVYTQQQQAMRKTVPKAEEKQKASSSMGQVSRAIEPQKSAVSTRQATVAAAALETADFQTAVGGATQGVLGRFAGNELQVIFWTKPEPSGEWVFGLMLGPRELMALAQSALPPSPPTGTRMAILNEDARPVARTPEGFTAEWKRPFVASEIGDVLPRWEAALYVENPGEFAQSARLVNLTLVLSIALALGAILAGGYLVAAETRRQMAAAQQRTDFVSNVSHELKTPLTSIRMFAELLAEDRVADAEKRKNFLQIIAAESKRLTRLVNNVLNFSALEKGRKTYHRKALDVRNTVESVWQTEEPRLRAAGFETKKETCEVPCPVMSDEDALAQILVNLLSNAEKYHGEHREITLTMERGEGELEIRVADRGRGVPAGREKKIFEPFVRGEDSLASEAQGTGLGLTLARRMARDLGGDITHRPREGGGSIFTLHLPLTPS